MPKKEPLWALLHKLPLQYAISDPAECSRAQNAVQRAAIHVEHSEDLELRITSELELPRLVFKRPVIGVRVVKGRIYTIATPDPIFRGSEDTRLLCVTEKCVRVAYAHASAEFNIWYRPADDGMASVG